MTAPEPRSLAVFFEPGSLSPFVIATAAAGYCSLVWVIDDRHFVDPLTRRLLARFGAVVEATGASPGTVAGELVALKVTGVATYSDLMLLETAAVADLAGLPFHRPAVAWVLRDKAAQRAALAAAGVPVPAFHRIPVEAGLDAETSGFVESVALPVVVKPARGASSRDAAVVTDRQTLRDLVRGRAEDLIVEGYLQGSRRAHRRGDFVSVETVVRAGVAHPLFITGRFPLIEPLRESGSFLPAEISPTEEAETRALATEAAAALGVVDGFLHTEIKLTPDGPRIIEVNGRVGGGIPGLVSATGGPDLIRWSMMLALGDPFPVEVPERHGIGYFYWEQPPMSAVSVREQAGVASLGHLDGVSSVLANIGRGQPVDWRLGGAGHVFEVNGWAPDHAILWQRIAEIDRTAAVTYD